MIKIDKNGVEISGNALDVLTDITMLVIKTRKALIDDAPNDLVKKAIAQSFDLAIVRAIKGDFATEPKDIDVIGFMNSIMNDPKGGDLSQ